MMGHRVRSPPPSPSPSCWPAVPPTRRRSAGSCSTSRTRGSRVERDRRRHKGTRRLVHPQRQRRLGPVLRPRPHRTDARDVRARRGQGVDWEDMAAAPLGGVPTLWFGDIGDNDAYAAGRQRLRRAASRPSTPAPAAHGPRARRSATASATPTGRTTPRRCWSTRGPRGSTSPPRPTTATPRCTSAPAHPSTTHGERARPSWRTVQWAPHPRLASLDLAAAGADHRGRLLARTAARSCCAPTPTPTFPARGTGPLAVGRAGSSGRREHITLPRPAAGRGHRLPP